MFKRRKKLKITLLSISAIILILMLIAPTLIKNYAINNSKELMGRQIDIGKLKYNYFTSTVKAYDFKMFEENGSDYFTTFDTLILNLEPLKLIKDKIEIEQFYIKGLMVKTIMKDEAFNFDDLIAFHNTPADSLVENSSSTESFKYSISNIELKDANIYFDNQDVNKETHLNDFSFAIPFIGWDQTEKSSADVKFNFKNGGYFESLLNINPVSGEYDAQITIENLYLNPFYEYVLEYADINDFDGNLNAQIKIHGNTNEAMKSIVSGHAEVDEFVMTDKNDKTFLSAKKITSDLNAIDYYNSNYQIGLLEFTDPYIFFQLDSVSNNYFRIFKLEDYFDESDTEQTGMTQTSDTLNDSDIAYGFDKLIVKGGVMDYTDNLTGNLFNYHLSEITIDSDSISSNSNWINIYSDMLLNERGTLNAKLGINPMDYDNLNLDIVIENFLLSDINIYASYYTGHNILLGDFYYYSKSKISNGDIISENQLLVKNVSVENKKNGIFTLPLKFALFLLKDKNGDVNLDVPVRGDMNDPEINIGKLVWTTIKNKITGAASDPISSLATIVDVDPADYRELVFEYTDTIPNENHYLKLDKLLEMETQKEGLKVKLEHHVDPKLQQEAIALATLGQQYLKAENKDYLEDEKGFKAYLQKETKNDTISINSAALILVDEPTLSGLSKNYNDALIRTINSYLKSKKPNTNIVAVITDPQEPDNKESQNTLKINFDMLTVMADDPENANK
jgi:hypothetical protein